MIPPVHHRSLAVGKLSAREIDGLVASAALLRQAALAGSPQPLLKGKNIGLLCESPDSADAALFERAATELGAHVARIRPSLSGLTTPREVQHTARMLGRLYDALACQGLPVELVQQVEREAGVPVYDGLASADHSKRVLVEQLSSKGFGGDDRRFLVQALLLNTIA